MSLFPLTLDELEFPNGALCSFPIRTPAYAAQSSSPGPRVGWLVLLPRAWTPPPTQVTGAPRDMVMTPTPLHCRCFCFDAVPS